MQSPKATTTMASAIHHLQHAGYACSISIMTDPDAILVMTAVPKDPAHGVIAALFARIKNALNDQYSTTLITVQTAA